MGISYEADIRKASRCWRSFWYRKSGCAGELGYNIFVDELGDSAVVLGVRFWTKTEDYWPVRWKMLEISNMPLTIMGSEFPIRRWMWHLAHAQGLKSG